MQVKLLALDIDGTLLNSNHKLTPRTIDAVQRAVEAGVHVVLVTGRRFHAARPIAAELGLRLPLVTHNGVLTKDTETLEIVDYHPLDGEFARELVKIGREYKADTLCCDDPEGEVALVYDHISEENYRLRFYISLFSEYAREVEDLHAYISGSPIQIFYTGSCAQMDRLAEAIESEMNGRGKIVLTAYREHDMTIVDVINPNCSKATGLECVARSLGIAREEIMAMGDNQNDLEMLLYAGFPVMMANADASLRDRGFAVASSNDEDGVAEAIEKYILS